MSGHLVVSNVGKAYRTWRSEWARVLSWFGLKVAPAEEHWVLRDVSFKVEPGEAVGIIGQNGAGKSTLLKMITGTAQPTEGAVRRGGRIAAILELGMGFNSDLTGRENAVHAAGLMGYSQEEIVAAMPAIEAFAEVGEYFDQPTRTYSSGMQMRVAFAVVTAWRPDVLIIDEALSVGDSYFQHKSFERIRQFKREGSTLLFVSHSMDSVRTLCDRAILLANGGVLKDGLPDEVADYYNALIAAKENESLSVEQRRNRDGWLYTRSGTGEALVRSLRLIDEGTGEEVKLARVGQRLKLVTEVGIEAALPVLVLGQMLRDRHGHVLWGTNTWHTHQRLEHLSEGEVVEFVLHFECNIGPGSYSFSPALVSSDTHLTDNYEWTDNALVFDVINADHPLFIGSSFLPVSFDITRSGVEASSASQQSLSGT
ncbi:ABC transporter ATP-binding protein [Pseudoxanthomonas sp. X-1]|uniref:ABC transporter ATP-binding protein n=1 Tax=Pseudoxanthomonas sp. X-1 TaxID=2571115 RepID=UPI00110BA477|nr:ABC transporter ATP-binding protein [Pseudoxanthomonas sp. X-1]TMN19318.1 ABC transporter ATP-binding protein [Pseudoxanthomonas sp. X-1]UAY74176.1 ABC transporter ATP-binding protein [Pseudoxanthomonas sp. X-1]